jgi:hypothetical protein
LFGLRFAPVSIPSIEVGGLAFKGASLGEHAVGALVSIATLLAAFYEIDNDAAPSNGDAKKSRVSSGARVDVGSSDDDVDASSATAMKKRR